jgi:diguanylate cyclase
MRPGLAKHDKEGDMKYHDSFANSAEHLGPSLSFMAKQVVAMDPVSYAVWYESIADINSPLKAGIDEHLKSGEVFDEKVIYEILTQYVADVDELAMQKFSDSLQKIMAEMSRAAALAVDQAGQFSNSPD